MIHHQKIKIPPYEHVQARTYTMSMPYSVQRIEEIVKQLESGDLKLRVRVLEVAHPLNILEEIITLWLILFVGSSQVCLFLRAQTLMRRT